MWTFWRTVGRGSQLYSTSLSRAHIFLDLSLLREEGRSQGSFAALFYLGVVCGEKILNFKSVQMINPPSSPDVCFTLTSQTGNRWVEYVGRGWWSLTSPVISHFEGKTDMYIASRFGDVRQPWIHSAFVLSLRGPQYCKDLNHRWKVNIHLLICFRSLFYKKCTQVLNYGF